MKNTASGQEFDSFLLQKQKAREVPEPFLIRSRDFDFKDQSVIFIRANILTRQRI